MLFAGVKQKNGIDDDQYWRQNRPPVKIFKV